MSHALHDCIFQSFDQNRRLQIELKKLLSGPFGAMYNVVLFRGRQLEIVIVDITAND